ncbi:MAG: ribonuclease R [Bacteroidia bacterium]
MASSKSLKHKINKVFSEAGRKILNPKQIAAKLEITSTEEKNLIIKVLKQMASENLIEEVSPGKYISVFKHRFIEGRVDMTQHGSAYVIPEDGSEDVFIAPEFLNRALHGDTVKIQLLATRSGSKPAGEVVEVISRAKKQFVGTVKLHFNYAFLIPDDKKMYVDIFIPKEFINGVKDGYKAIAEITEWHIAEHNPFGKIVEVLGKPGEHNTEMNAIVAEFGFASKFPEQVENAAKKISDKIPKEEIAKREDFRNTLTFTIDPEDAKDFDDAISYKLLDNGNIEVGIHIADVSHYVTKNSVIDKEAYQRGTSVYLVDRTIPMLPEKLSNNLCSLRPNEDKLTFSVIVEINNEAKVLKHRIAKTIIHSQRRFTYEEAQQRIEKGEGDFANELITLNNIAKQIRERRFKNGAISFESNEVKFRLDENFKPIDVYLKVRKDAHKLIEEFMLLANRLVAEFGSTKNKQGKAKTFVYRVHDDPSEEKLNLFKTFAARFGYHLKTDSAKSVAFSLNQISEAVEGKPEQNIIQSQAIRTMSKAFYGTKKTGHYGLGFSHYTHFTSPIRRYPDLMVHRLLFDYLNGEKSASQDEYEDYCKHSSAMEVKAAEAERASIRYKQVEYMQDFVGHEFDAIISGITDWGIYAEMTQFKCEGMLRLADLDEDYYEYDEQNQWIVGRRTRKKYQLGDIIRVLVLRTDIFKRQIDLAMVSETKAKSFVNDWLKPNKKKKQIEAKNNTKRKRRR